jgi:hypothetical protein
MMSIRNRRMKDYTIYGLVAVALFTVALLLYSMLMPFHPYHLYSYNVQPYTTCMGDATHITIHRKIDEGNWHVIVDGRWKEVGTDNFVEVPIGDYWIRSDGTEDYAAPSPMLQEAPEKPGRWAFNADVTVQGRVGILPRTSEIPETDATPIKVLSDNLKTCS